MEGYHTPYPWSRDPVLHAHMMRSFMAQNNQLYLPSSIPALNYFNPLQNQQNIFSQQQNQQLKQNHKVYLLILQ